MPTELDPERLRALIKAGRAIVADLDLDSILGRVLDVARELTGARYAALGVLDEAREGLERFVTRGIDAETEHEIGARPRGRGVLGVLITDARPLRVASVSDHPASFGFPPHHPAMGTFLGVPVLIRGRAWGNLYLAEKDSGEFDDADEQTVVVLADWAAIAVENARLYADGENRRDELERALHGLEATQAVVLAVGAEPDLARILELVVEQARSLAQARRVVIFLRDGDDLVRAASAGETGPGETDRIPVEGSTSGEVMLRGTPERIADVHAQMLVPPAHFGVDNAVSALVVPLVHHGDALGVLVAFDHGDGAGPFDEDDEQALKAFAASAATAVATAQSVEQDRLRYAMAAADAERRRWAQELHDETLQALGALRLLLSAARRSGDATATARAVDDAIGGLEQEITNLRAIINELRPAALDQLGLVPALEALFERHRVVNDLEIAATLPDPADAPRAADAAHTVYRVVQEALTNVVKHSHAHHVDVELALADDELTLIVADDGHGFAVQDTGSGFGLIGMRERVLLAGGELQMTSDPEGTRICVTMPLAP